MVARMRICIYYSSVHNNVHFVDFVAAKLPSVMDKYLDHRPDTACNNDKSQHGSLRFLRER